MSEWKAGQSSSGVWYVMGVDADGRFTHTIVECRHGADPEALARRIAELPKLEAIVDQLPKSWRLDKSGTPVKDVPVVMKDKR